MNIEKINELLRDGNSEEHEAAALFLLGCLIGGFIGEVMTDDGDCQ